MTPTHEELVKLRELTRMTGLLTNLQIQQLKMWPQIVLAANDAEIEFDPELRLVAVSISNLDYASMQERAPTEDIVTVFNRRMNKFNQCVKFLLGDEYSVVIEMKGRRLGYFPPKELTLTAHPPKNEYDSRNR